MARLEQALAAGQSAGPNVATQPVTSVQSVPLPQAPRPQVAQPRFSVDDRAVDRGTVELMALGSFSGVSVAGETASAVILNTFVGVFATPKAEVGVSTSVLKLGDLNTSGDVMGHFYFNFPNSSALLPFVGGGLGTTFGDADIVGHPLTLQLTGGFRVMMPGGGGALVIQPFYQRANVSSDFVDVNLNTYGVAIGASLLF